MIFADGIIRALMSHQPAHHPVIDGFEFAAAGAVQRGTMPVRGFARLRDLLASDAGEVAYEVEGLRDGRGRPALRIRVRGALQLRCQRCLEAMKRDVDEEETLVLAANQAEIDADPVDPQAPDRLLAGKEMALRELIEDQLILALPYAPRHAGCDAAARSEKKKQDEDKLSPFAGLKGLLRGRH
jgi:uncharacterized protein